MNVKLVAEELRSLLLDAPPATVFIVHVDGSIAVQTPGMVSFAGIDRQRRALATFTASSLALTHEQVVARLRQGLLKYGQPDSLVG